MARKSNGILLLIGSLAGSQLACTRVAHPESVCSPNDSLSHLQRVHPDEPVSKHLSIAISPHDEPLTYVDLTPSPEISVFLRSRFGRDYLADCSLYAYAYERPDSVVVYVRPLTTLSTISVFGKVSGYVVDVEKEFTSFKSLLPGEEAVHSSAVNLKVDDDVMIRLPFDVHVVVLPESSHLHEFGFSKIAANIAWGEPDVEPEMGEIE